MATAPMWLATARVTERAQQLLDMAIADATDLVRALLAVRPGLKIVALGVPDDNMAVVASAEAGLCGYVSRDASLEDVGNALKATLQGEAPVPGRVAAGLLQHIAFRARSREAATSGAADAARTRGAVSLADRDDQPADRARSIFN